MNYLQRIKQKIFLDIPYHGMHHIAGQGSEPIPANQGERIYNEYGLHMDDLRKQAGIKWSDIKNDPAALQTLAYSIHTQRMIDRGEVPSDYKYIALCRGCGPVWLWYKGKLEGCPWCWNRLRGKTVPYPGDRFHSSGKDESGRVSGG